MSNNGHMGNRVSAKAAEFSSLAPDETPLGFALPDGPGLREMPPETAKTAGALESPQDFQPPEHPGPELSSVAPAATPPRDPTVPFDNVTAPVTEGSFDPRKPFNAGLANSVDPSQLPPPTGEPVASSQSAPPPRAEPQQPAPAPRTYPPMGGQNRAIPGVMGPRINPYPPNPYATGAYNQAGYGPPSPNRGIPRPR